MSRIPIIYHTNIKFYTQYTHPTLICRGTDARTHAHTDGRTENIYLIFRDKLLLLGEHVLADSSSKSKQLMSLALMNEESAGHNEEKNLNRKN